MPAVIDLVEPMGSVNNIVLRLDGIDTATTDGDPLIAVVTSNESFMPGARTWLTLRPERLVLFAVGTETAFAVLSVTRDWQSVTSLFRRERRAIEGARRRFRNVTFAHVLGEARWIALLRIAITTAARGYQRDAISRLERSRWRTCCWTPCHKARAPSARCDSPDLVISVPPLPPGSPPNSAHGFTSWRSLHWLPVIGTSSDQQSPAIAKPAAPLAGTARIGNQFAAFDA